MNNTETVKRDNMQVADMMVTAIARLLKNGETVFHGVSSPVPMIAVKLAKRLQAPDLVYLNIPGGVDGNPSGMLDTSTAGADLLNKSPAYFPLMEVFDLSMRGRLDVAFLSGVQFDPYGNVNASVIGDYNKPKVRLPGGAGSAVLIPTARKPVIWRTVHDKRTFVEKCDFNTTRGNLYRIVTPLCMFRMEDGRLVLDSVFHYSSVDEVRANTGFEIIAKDIKIEPAPTQEELRHLRAADPKKLRLTEFK